MAVVTFVTVFTFKVLTHVNDGLFKNADTGSYKRLPSSKDNKLTSLEMKVVDYFQIEQHHWGNKIECAFKQKFYFYLICTLYSKHMLE